MSRMITAAVLALLLAVPLGVSAKPASEASIRELLAVTHAKRLLNSEMSRVDAMMRQEMRRGLGGRQLSPKEQKIMDDTAAKLAALFKEEMNWKTLEPTFINIYRRSFSQDEINGMLKFYRSRVGKAVIAKMPLVMRGSIEMMQDRMRAIMPKVIKIEQDSFAQLKAASGAQ